MRGAGLGTTGAHPDQGMPIGGEKQMMMISSLTPRPNFNLMIQELGWR